MQAERTGGAFRGEADIPAHENDTLHSEWRAPYGSIVTVLATDEQGSETALFTVVGGIV